MLCDDVPVCIVTFSLQKSFKDQIAKVEGGQPLGDLPKLPLPKPPQPPKTPMLPPAMVGHGVKDIKCIKQAIKAIINKKKQVLYFICLLHIFRLHLAAFFSGLIFTAMSHDLHHVTEAGT